MACCRDGREVYSPLSKPVSVIKEQKSFSTSLVRWRDIVESILYNEYYKIAEDECAGMGTLGLCKFTLTTTKVNEIRTNIFM